VVGSIDFEAKGKNRKINKKKLRQSENTTAGKKKKTNPLWFWKKKKKYTEPTYEKKQRYT